VTDDKRREVVSRIMKKHFFEERSELLPLKVEDEDDGRTLASSLKFSTRSSMRPKLFADTPCTRCDIQRQKIFRSLRYYQRTKKKEY
jgi:hypothetical protein